MTLSAARHVAAAVVCALVLIALRSPASAQTVAGPVAVRVYDFSALDNAIRTRAATEARAIVADAGVNADWRDCSQRRGCTGARGELIVRIIRENGGRAAESRRTLGYSVIDIAAGTGTLATIYINRVEDTARQAGFDLALLLGRAIAHEIGHLIMRTNDHGDEGLMRAIWTEQELSRNQPEDWTFASPDRSHIRAALQQVSPTAER
jgi:hypothetical protein